MEDEYREAINFFQKYPDQWQKLLNGVLAKRNSIFDETNAAALRPEINERLQVVYALQCRGAAFDEVARDFAGDWSGYEVEDLPEPE